MRSLSSSMAYETFAITGWRRSRGLFEGGRSGDRRRELATVLWAGLWRIAAGKAVEHLAKAFLGQVLVGVFPDQHHRRVHAGAQALDLLPAEIAVLGEVKLIVMDAALAELDDVGRAAQAARRGTADLDVGLLADRRELEHRVEGRNLEHADVRHLEQVSDGADRGFRNPALMLLLHPPEDRNRRRGLTAGRIFGHLLPG